MSHLFASMQPVLLLHLFCTSGSHKFLCAIIPCGSLVPLVFLSSDSKVWGLALSFLYQATGVYSQPLDWLPVGYVLILVQSAVVRRDDLVVLAPGSVTWEWQAVAQYGMSSTNRRGEHPLYLHEGLLKDFYFMSTIRY